MVRYLALGDSYTIGERVDSVDRWPDRLARELESAGIPLVDLQIIAQTGWTTSELDAAIDGVDPQGRFGLVSLLIGVNNQFRGADIAEYRTEFVGLLNRDWGVTPFASSYGSAQIAEEIDAFKAVAELEAVAAGSHWVDITPT
jgi:lysophospholipase L1-like esterase